MIFINNKMMITALIKIRFKQLMREFSGIGIFRFLFLIGLAVFLGAMIFTFIGKTPHKFYVSGISLLLILSMHIKRTDRNFIKILVLRPYRVYFTEYSLLSLPLIFSLVYFQEWLIIIGFIFGLLIISFIAYSPKPVTRNNRLIGLIPSRSFEWKAGARKNYLFMAVIWVAGMLASFIVGVVPVAIIVLAFIIFGFYQQNEPVSILISRELGTKKFLWDKIVDLQLQFTLLLAPLLFAFFIFHPQFWFVPVLEYVLFSFVFVYIVLMKYAFYEPGSKNSANQILVAFGPLSILVPFMLPVIWLLSIKFYFNAKSNLKIYLDDFN